MSGECEGHQGRHVNKLIAIWLWLKKKFVVYINCSCLVIKSPFWYWDINKNKQKNKKIGLSMVSTPPLHYNGGGGDTYNLKICQNFVGSNIYYYNFIISFL